MAAMTTRERVQALVSHGDYDEYLIAAVLDVDVSTVARVLADPSYEPPAPGGSGGSVWTPISKPCGAVNAVDGDLVIFTGFTIADGITNSNATLNAATDEFTADLVGALIDDSQWDGDVPSGTTVLSVESPTSLTMSAGAFGSDTADTVAFGLIVHLPAPALGSRVGVIRLAADYPDRSNGLTAPLQLVPVSGTVPVTDMPFQSSCIVLVGDGINWQLESVVGPPFGVGTGEGSAQMFGGDNASGFFAIAEGGGTTASGGHSHAEGLATTASGDSAHSEGLLTAASGNRSHAEGESTVASGDKSHAEGLGNTASGNQSHAEGGETGLPVTASGASSHAEGQNTVASGLASHAEGFGTTASDDQSHAEGAGTTASGLQSHAEGSTSVASGDFSHAESYNNYAVGTASHAEGWQSSAIGAASHAEGAGAIAWADWLWALSSGSKGARAPGSGPWESGSRSQYSFWVPYNTTTNATPTPLGVLAGADDIGFGTPDVLALTFPDFITTALVEARVVARRTDTPGTASAWDLTVLLDANGTNAYRIVGSQSKSVVVQDAAASAWDVNFSLTAPNKLVITVTGEAAKTIAWTCTLKLYEIAA